VYWACFELMPYQFLHLFAVICIVWYLCSSNLNFNCSTGICVFVWLLFVVWFNTCHDDPFISAMVSKSTAWRNVDNIWFVIIYLEWMYPSKKFSL
jgi:hypothetical protein